MWWLAHHNPEDNTSGGQGDKYRQNGQDDGALSRTAPGLFDFHLGGFLILELRARRDKVLRFSLQPGRISVGQTTGSDTGSRIYFNLFIYYLLLSFFFFWGGGLDLSLPKSKEADLGKGSS